jgi:hypothetical protein
MIRTKLLSTVKKFNLWALSNVRGDCGLLRTLKLGNAHLLCLRRRESRLERILWDGFRLGRKIARSVSTCVVAEVLAWTRSICDDLRLFLYGDPTDLRTATFSRAFIGCFTPELALSSRPKNLSILIT